MQGVNLGILHVVPGGNTFGVYYVISKAPGKTLPTDRLLAPFLDMQTPDGVVTRITSDQGAVDGSKGQVSLSGAVRFSNDLGYQVDTEGIRFALDRTALETTGGIRATGPFGSLTAGGMVLRPSDQSGSYVLVFNGGVKLLYDPKG